MFTDLASLTNSVAQDAVMPKDLPWNTIPAQPAVATSKLFAGGAGFGTSVATAALNATTSVVLATAPFVFKRSRPYILQVRE